LFLNVDDVLEPLYTVAIGTMYDGPKIQNANEYETMKRASFSTL